MATLADAIAAVLDGCPTKRAAGAPCAGCVAAAKRIEALTRAPAPAPAPPVAGDAIVHAARMQAARERRPVTTRPTANRRGATTITAFPDGNTVPGTPWNGWCACPLTRRQPKTIATHGAFDERCGRWIAPEPAGDADDRAVADAAAIEAAGGTPRFVVRAEGGVFTDVRAEDARADAQAADEREGADAHELAIDEQIRKGG
jgi:hypothetical protein